MATIELGESAGRAFGYSPRSARALPNKAPLSDNAVFHARNSRAEDCSLFGGIIQVCDSSLG
jgi:hypothetical protein